MKTHAFILIVLLLAGASVTVVLGQGDATAAEPMNEQPADAAVNDQSADVPQDAPADVEAAETPSPPADPAEPKTRVFAQAANGVHEQLRQSIRELSELEEQIAESTIPLNRQLRELENQRTEVRTEYQRVSRLLDSRTLDLSNLRSEIEKRENEATYLSNLISEYIRNFETRLHIAEIHRYEQALDAAKSAADSNKHSQLQMFKAQTDMIATSLDRLEEALGGSRFTGSAVDDITRDVHPGTFVLVGPAALFQSKDGKVVGTVEQRLGSLEPTVYIFDKPEQAAKAAELTETGSGWFPLDPTLGNARKIEATQDTIWEHIQKGGPVMVPIFTLAGAALLVALYKWVTLLFQRKPSQRRIRQLLEAMAKQDEKAVHQYVKAVKGPVGVMLAAGVQHLSAPRELIEEVMYETILATRLKLQRLLPFIAITAASAPLLGLLGTVTGIINTFRLITVHGTGDVKTLSGGISEALITTEFGLIVAIPSLLLHAFLSRKARSIIDAMEKAAIAFANQVAKTPFHRAENVDNAA